jgi:hypothetical protein
MSEGNAVGREFGRRFLIRTLGVTLLGVALIAVIGCAGVDPVASPTALGEIRALSHVADPDSTGPRICDTALLQGTLTGDRDDPRIAWIVAAGGSRVDVSWPNGLSARFAPGLEIVTADGSVLIRGGDLVRLGGGVGPDGSVFGICAVNGVVF